MKWIKVAIAFVVVVAAAAFFVVDAAAAVVVVLCHATHVLVHNEGIIK